MLKFTISFYAFSLFYLGAHLSLISIAGMVLVVTRNCYWLKTWTGRLQSWEVVFLWVYRGRGIEDCGCLWVWYRGSFQEASGGSAFRCQEGRVTFWLKGWTSRRRRQLWGSTAWVYSKPCHPLLWVDQSPKFSFSLIIFISMTQGCLHLHPWQPPHLSLSVSTMLN